MLVTSACGPAAAPADRVRVTGASTLYPIVVMAGEELRAEGLDVQAQAGGSTRGFEDVVAGRADLGAMARDPTEEEARQVLRFPVALDGVGVVVHGDNPLPEVSTEQLRRIYRGEIRRWENLAFDAQALPGGDQATGAAAGAKIEAEIEGDIVVVSKAEGHATLETFLEHVGLDRRELQVDVVAGDNAQVIRVVANTPGSIGYVSLAEVLHAIDAGTSLRLVRLDGVEPVPAAVSAGEYPMYRTLYLVSKGEPSESSRRLLDFLGGDGGRAVIERGKYVPLAP